MVLFSVPEVCLRVAQNIGFIEHFTNYIQEIPRDDATEKADALICKLHDLRKEMEHVDQMLAKPSTKVLMDYAYIIDGTPFLTACLVVLLSSIFFGDKTIVRLSIASLCSPPF